jgi:hypothetical protein
MNAAMPFGFLIMGIAWWGRPGWVADINTYVGRTAVRGFDRLRLRAACRQRGELEAVDTRAARCFPPLCFGAALLCAAGLVPAPLCLAGLTAGLAAIFALSLWQVRGAGARRLATLRRRNPTEVVPWYWFALLCGNAAAIVTAADVRAPNASALLAASASVCCACVAWRIAGMPALLSGADLEAERFVDQRLRFGRATGVLFLAYAVLPLYSYLGVFAGWEWPVRFLAQFSFIAFSLWLGRAKLQPERISLS